MSSDEILRKQLVPPALSAADVRALAADWFPLTFAPEPTTLPSAQLQAFQEAGEDVAVDKKKDRYVQGLDSYDDKNFKLSRVHYTLTAQTGGDGGVDMRGPFTLKIHNGADSVSANRVELEMQDAVLLHLHAGGVVVPRPLGGIKNVRLGVRAPPDWHTHTGGDSGEDGGGDGQVMFSARLLTWVEGELLEHRAVNEAVLISTGACLAACTRLLASFDHAGAHRVHLWDLQQCAEVEGFVQSIGDPAQRDLAADAFAVMASDVLPLFAQVCE
jgi:hypothetical protein